MIRPIMKDVIFLAQKSVPAVNCEEDMQVARDLLETLEAHKEGCVGMAANMIGETRRIIVFQDGDSYGSMLNPEILKAEEPYDTEEGCLSLLGGPRKCRRYQKIKVRWQTENFQIRIKNFEGWTAQIIQHEIDHCNGIII